MVAAMEWVAWCNQTASCIWWPFDTYREFVLFIVAPLAIASLVLRR